MSERLREFLADVRENWDDDYWWARHQVLRATLIAIVMGAISLFFTWLETRIQATAAEAT